MGKLAALKRHARSALNKLDLEFPVSTWQTTNDPVKMNAIYPYREWQLDSPVSKFTEGKQDWIHWYICDPAQAAHLEIYFERFQEQIAMAWARLKLNNRVLILHKAFYKDSSDGHAYSAGGIRLECTAAMRGWRLALNVMMDEPATGAKVHVRMGAQVAMVGHTLEMPKQLKPSFLARVFKKMDNLENAKREISKCCKECQAICQPVSVFAEIALDGQKQELMLFGSRLKFFGDSNMLEDAIIHVAYAENGTTLTAIQTGLKAYGYCCNPAHHVKPIRKTYWTASREEFTLNFEAAESKYTLTLVDREAGVCNEGEHLLAGKEKFLVSRTLLSRSKLSNLPEGKFELCKLLQYPDKPNDSLLLTTSDPACKDPKLTGGKGSSLAVLTSISNHFKTFTVPSAVVLTVNAYAMFAEQPEVAKAIDEFIESSKMVDMTALKEVSDRCVALISDAGLPETIQKSLMEKLQELFGPLWFLKKFAVRSSAVDEDSEEMSAAGQMTTYLGMRGELAISSAVVKCWASQFSLTAVNYKRQYGQALNSSMAVVVQEMVSAECAGVMFTCDPVTSHPLGIFITANFGLGESVVSATADPDTYSLRRVDTGISLENKTCGAKSSMVIESGDGNGTTEMSIESDKSKTFCLSDDRALEIASIGAALSDITNSPRDIEWAVVGGKIYLLQSRPVTSFLRESDFEIRHDFNTGFYTNREILSRANLDEVMPGAFSTMGLSIFGHLLFDAFGKKKAEWGKCDPSQFTYLSNGGCGKRIYMNFSQHGFARNKMVLKTNAVTMFGYDISDHEALKKGIVHATPKPPALGLVPMMLQAFRDLSPLVNKMRREAEKFQFEPPEKKDSLSLFLSVIRHVSKLGPFMDGLIAATMPSAIFNVMTLNIIKNSQGAEDFSPDLMIQFSKLLRSDLEVESAHIPNELTALSNLLRQDPNAEKFLETTPEEALRWLETDTGTAAEQFRQIRSKHAHRCYKEFDIHARTWDIDPIPLVQTLQSTASHPAPDVQKKEEESMTIDHLPKRPSFFQRRLLNFLIPRAKYAVYAREATKSALVKGIHIIRRAMRDVALQLQAEGRLPDPELIFFLSCDEVFRFITARDPSLLPKALRRQKLHAILDQERYPVLMYGMPKPIDSATVVIDPNAESMEGVPVSEGVVTGPARVILNFLTEAHLIKKGEILVTRATDTGWTPYFPLLGGVVTEVGGLLSHGAVVAREYGLPAVVGIASVTQFVKSGDIVTLDGNKGVLHKTPASKICGSKDSQSDGPDGLPPIEEEPSDGKALAAQDTVEKSESSRDAVDHPTPTLRTQTSLDQDEGKHVVAEIGDTLPLIQSEA